LQNTSELTKSLFADLRKGTGATVISSAGGMEFAMESSQWQNGLFTYCFINGLQSKAADLNKDGVIMLSELQQYVATQVTQIIQRKTTTHLTYRKQCVGLEGVVNKFKLIKMKNTLYLFLFQIFICSSILSQSKEDFKVYTYLTDTILFDCSNDLMIETKWDKSKIFLTGNNIFINIMK
jgi:hypothetical protein